MSDSKPQPTEEFWRAFVSGGTNAPQCDGCGTTYFASNGFYEKGELEALQAKAQTKPEEYVEEDCDTIAMCNIDGKYIVDGCEKCAERITRYENFVWEHRDQILWYLKARAESEQKETQRTLAQLENFARSV